VLDSFYTGAIGADIAVIEGVMGMYDGMDRSTYGSTAHIAKILKAPLLLVIPVHGMATSVHAIAHGFKNFEPDSPLAGVILNKASSARHKELLTGGAIPQLGFIPKDEAFYTQSRHLGLVMGEETNTEIPISIIEESCDISGIISCATSAPALIIRHKKNESNAKKARIGVAKDPAFCFYYQHNLEILEQSGAELVYFSPIQDHLPDVDALYVGGGYPELYADLLEAGAARAEIRRACEEEMPVYGECGGLLYLTERLIGEKTYRWVGALPATCTMADRFQALGYCEGKTTGGTSFTPFGIDIRGHEFHYSSVTPDRDASYAIRLTRGKGIEDGHDGMYAHETVGCYTHGWFSRSFSDAIVQSACHWKKR